MKKINIIILIIVMFILSGCGKYVTFRGEEIYKIEVAPYSEAYTMIPQTIYSHKKLRAFIKAIENAKEDIGSIASEPIVSFAGPYQYNITIHYNDYSTFHYYLWIDEESAVISEQFGSSKLQIQHDDFEAVKNYIHK
jgi:hypothetical protein